MIKKTILFIACTVVAICLKAQITSIEYPSGYLSEEKITQILKTSKENGTQAWELQKHNEHLHQLLKKQQDAIANGTYTTAQRTITPPQVMAGCTNVGFEDGTTTGWTMNVGNNSSSSNLPCPTCITPGGSGGLYQVVNSTSTATVNTVGTCQCAPIDCTPELCNNGVDRFGGFPVVAPAPLGGSYSLLMNHSMCGYAMEQAIQSFVVDASNYSFTFQYAAVLQSSSHPASAAPYFQVSATDLNTGALLPCAQYSNTATSGTMAGWTASTVDASVYWYPWTTVTLDLSSILTHTVSIAFTVSDCNQGGHFGYCYIDASCNSSTAQITQSNNLCTGGSTILSGPAGMASYSWAGPATGTTQNLVTGTAGNYTLTTTSATGCPAPLLYYNLTQGTGTPPTVSVVATHDSICSGALTTLTASGASTYSWSTSATTSSINVTPTVTTIYTVTGTDATSGCANSVTHSIEIFNPGISIQAINNPLCSGTTATLTASGASTYTWSTNAGSLTTNSVAVSPTANTTYTVTGTDAAHSCISSTTVVVYMARNVAIQNPSTTICEGTSVTLTASGASTYTWSTGATTANITVTPTVTTSYTVTGSVTCTNISTATINVNAIPNLQVTASTTTLCAGTPATLTASGADTYSWSTSATTTSIMVTPTVTTIYTVTGTATSTNCKKTDTLSIIVMNCSTGINQLTGGVEQVSIYPNPTKDMLYVSCKLKNSTLFITDILGNKIKQVNADTELTSIDMSSLSEGVYFITIKTANNTITKKIVVQR